MKIYRFLRGKMILIPLAAIFLFINACDTTTEPTNKSFSLSFKTGSSLQKVNDGIELTEVKILLKDIKLETESDSESVGDNGNNDGKCEEIRVGPFVVNLNLNGITTDFMVNDLPAGTYDELEFEIHQLEASETPPDSEFKDGNECSQLYSVIVKGNYDTTQFVYKSTVSARQELEFDNPLVIEENTSTNLTITVDPYSWFYKEGVLMDPTDRANECDIDNNIKHSFKSVFEDNNYDGKVD